ncbi:glycosyltransferase family 32 protein [Parathielavia hyrcaniae]|uniref:Glycosyltransferase family 32 protein n=1 Tax=Parathielavia hyrcaniae TaxID=113614 RepID=A0AAN6Q231_9PEZI|nr:glycosyltransferase family 32 protein [Parathielavia hyrcaniae]
MRISLRISVVLWAVALSIFFEHAEIRLTRPQVAAAGASNNTNAQPVPKIVHHVFHNWREPGNDELPSEWATMRKECQDLNPSFEFKLWTESASRAFIETEYPWFLNTDGYRYPVQRVDAGCKADLTPLFSYPVWVTDGGRGALSNNILGAQPNHPFWNHLTLSLLRYNWNWPLPYVTIMYSSGQWFLTAMWEYHDLLPKPEANPDLEHRLYHIMMDGLPGADPWVSFCHQDGGGGAWNNWDNKLTMGIGDHIFLVLATVVGGVALMVWLGLRCIHKYRRTRGGYTRLTNRPASVV